MSYPPLRNQDETEVWAALGFSLVLWATVGLAILITRIL